MFARAGPVLDRVAEHEVGAVEEEEDQEEHELVVTPDPPDTPGDPRPDRAGGQGVSVPKITPWWIAT